jgi:hypothetical protein
MVTGAEKEHFFIHGLVSETSCIGHTLLSVGRTYRLSKLCRENKEVKI